MQVLENQLKISPTELRDIHVGSKINFDYDIGHGDSSTMTGILRAVLDDGSIQLEAGSTGWIRGAETSHMVNPNLSFDLERVSELRITPGKATRRALAEEAAEKALDRGEEASLSEASFARSFPESKSS